MFYIGIIIICLVGTLLHFTYEFSHHNKYVALFSAVNESTWEHIKICMTPTILWSIYEIIEYGLDGHPCNHHHNHKHYNNCKIKIF